MMGMVKVVEGAVMSVRERKREALINMMSPPATHLFFVRAIVLVFVAIRIGEALGSPLNLRGISPQDESYYKTATIWCRDRSKNFTPDRLNDDFCDCIDGTDEPGTSACPNGKFFCKNRGHTPLFLFSSRVNDGICDCCDGSDEYDGRANCPNTCFEAGKALMERLDRKIAIFRSGLEIRNRDVVKAKHMIQKDKEELSSLKQEEKKLKDLVSKLKSKKEAIEKAVRLEKEREEKLRKEKEEKEKMEAEKQDSMEENSAWMEDQSMEQSSGEIDDSLEEGKAENDQVEEITSESMSKEELGRLVASRWTGEDPNLESGHADDVDEDGGGDSLEAPEGDDDSGSDHEQEHESNDNDDAAADDDEYDDDEPEEQIQNGDFDAKDEATGENVLTDDHVVKGPWLWMKVKDVFKSLLSFYSVPKLPLSKTEADRVLKEYDDADSNLRNIQSKISDLEKKLEQDFGKDGEFYGFYGQCFELKLKRYTYKLCPYRNGVQMEGHSTTTLGNWDGFKDDYKSMQFVRGDRCWNGPDRSLKVKLRCGTKIELTDVDEPSRCEYVAELMTPALCLEERLAALQRRRNDEGEVLHDEL